MLSINAMHGPNQSNETVPLNLDSLYRKPRTGAMFSQNSEKQTVKETLALEIVLKLKKQYIMIKLRKLESKTK